MAATASTLTIVLATVIPVVFVILVILIIWRCARRRSYELFNRGITPVADEEIESWKNDRQIDDEKEPMPEPLIRGPRAQNHSINTHHQGTEKSGATSPASSKHHQHKSSVSSITKPPSVIVYQNPSGLGSRHSDEQLPRSPTTKYSLEYLQAPIQARAPNARPGLTDDAVQGDAPFIPQLKRQPSRLSKNNPQGQLPSPTQAQHQRHKSAIGTMGATEVQGDRWYGSQAYGQDYQSRKSADNIPRRGVSGRAHNHIYSSTENPPRRSLDDASPGGLSPRPLLRKSEIGRAIG